MHKSLREQIVDGLLYTHSRLNANTTKGLETAAFLYALIELLEEKGFLSIEELDERKEIVGQRLAEQYREQKLGAMFQDPEYDKYSFESEVDIDCDKRIHLCGAACCRLPFALSKQDVREGIVHWDLGQPYLIEHGDNGHCIHMDRESCHCTIYAARPVPCRAFDCRGDERIWLDFDAMIPNPEIQRADWPACLKQETEAVPA